MIGEIYSAEHVNLCLRYSSLMGDVMTKDSTHNARRAFNQNSMRERLACGFVACEEKNRL